MRLRLGVAGSVLCLVATSCSSTVSRDLLATADNEATILALGDSIFEWNSNEGSSIPDVIGETLDTPVINAAVSGASFSNPDPDAAADGPDVRQQYQEGDWDWVVIDGGANNVAAAIEGIEETNDLVG